MAATDGATHAPGLRLTSHTAATHFTGWQHSTLRSGPTLVATALFDVRRVRWQVCRSVQRLRSQMAIHSLTMAATSGATRAPRTAT